MRKHYLIPQNFDTSFYIVLWNRMQHIPKLLQVFVVSPLTEIKCARKRFSKSHCEVCEMQYAKNKYQDVQLHPVQFLRCASHACFSGYSDTQSSVQRKICHKRHTVCRVKINKVILPE